ncbi:uncharacterized protein [Leptinotarsa decemlineata]|uniref:uncharacterized protein n=1 Tax=Leptinotarsa decemlineata TaxID=7539 RepID=UPI003D307755
MFNTPINQAHKLRHQAEVFQKFKEYDQSITCHQKSAEYFAKARDITTNKAAKESITYQMEHALKQIRVIDMKKKKDEIENSKNYNETKNNNGDLDSLKDIIYRNIEVHDSLISYLGNKENSNGSLKYYPVSHAEKSGSSSTQIICNVHPKSDTQIIEELTVLSGHYRDAVLNLVVQLEDRNKEIVKLKDIIKTLEKEKQKGTENQN